MDRDSANATRLRVNRISLIQQIDTRELIPKLIRTNIISADHDVQYINRGTSRIDRARRLIDCLLGEENENVNRPVNWYLLFRSILLENPSVYTDLVRVLDTTRIQTPDVNNCKSSQAFTDQPNSSQSDEHQESNKQDSFDQTEEQQMNNSKKINNIQNQIKNIQFDRYAMNKILIEGSFQKVIDNLTFNSQIPERLFTQLKHSTNAYDREQLLSEQKVFDNMRRIELFINLMKEEKSLSNQNIFDTQVVDLLFNDPVHQHHFYKYFFSLSLVYGIHYDQQFTQAYRNLLDKQNNVLTAIDNGFLLYHFLYNYGRFELCQEIIESIVQSLTKLVKNHDQKSIIWTYLFRGCCALIQAHNQSFQIQEAWTRIEAANEIADSLNAAGIEIANDEYGWLYTAITQTAYEDANFDACIQYSYKGLKLVDKNNHSLIVDLLCSLTQGLTAKWVMNKAQETAVMAVQYAGKYCGRNSPKYIHALQQLLQYSNEFIQDQSSVELAQYTLDRAQTVYGYESLTVAHCHRALSKSLINFASLTQSRRNIKYPLFEEDIIYYQNTSITDLPPSSSTYIHHAYEAYRMAQDWFGVDSRIQLFPFKMTLAHALQAHVAANFSNKQNTHFEDAIELLNDCLSIARNIFGSMSFKVAQIHRLQSATYLSNKMYNEAEEELQTCLQIYKLCLPPNSFHYLVTKASLGLIYKQKGDYEQALMLFQDISESLDTKTQSFRWINMVLESLIECHSHIEARTNEDSPRIKSAADKVRSELYEWRRANMKRINILNLIHQEPTRSLEQFVQDLTKFQQTTDRLHTLIHIQQKVPTRITPIKIHQET
ncbi:unnamed protein product [Rotaria socialis]|uniref:CARD domain-containing protein n=1 Tax=Rotaria socialis TaxID=392032 RepID=A0A817PPJ8_9BILA|nr:unnamed protein product [Rotaria socialis]CAF3532848.1 unnamed protein product [Rotaria socialis]CAF4327356.1 unnamed protein product [Rotaria socialis]CAF4739286.1 unnamed protein product [Rotaria socialis]